jgi:hypothetical protein
LSIKNGLKDKIKDAVTVVVKTLRYEPFPINTSRCSHITLTIKTGLRSTRLPLLKGPHQAMNMVVSASKGISKVALARLIRVTQPVARRIGHTVYKMMDPQPSDVLLGLGALLN